MHKILFILLFFPIICFASFPVVTDAKEAEKITFSTNDDFNQKTIDENNIQIVKSSYETNSFWKVYRLLRRIFLAVVIIVVIVSLITNIN